MNQQVLIWGTTPLAAWLAARLPALADPDTSLTWLADAQVEADLAAAGGLHLDGQPPLRELALVTELAAVFHPDSRPDVILLAAPNWFSASAAQQLQQVLALGQRPPLIVSLQNGVGSVQRLEAILGQHGEPYTLTAALTRPFWYPHYREGRPHHAYVHSAAWGGVALQAEHPYARKLGAWLGRAGLSVTYGWAEAIQWSSAFWGIQGAALSAVLNHAPQEIYREPGWFAYEEAQLLEALAVLEAQQVRLMRLPGVNVPRMAWQARYLPSPLLAPLLSAHPRPAGFLNDLRFGTGRSDAAYFNGAFALHGHKAGIPTPVNHALALVLTDLAEGRMSWAQMQARPELLKAAIRLAG